jgi:hypothetical protein
MRYVGSTLVPYALREKAGQETYHPDWVVDPVKG